MSRPPILMHRRGSQLIAHGPMDEEAIRALPAGKVLKVAVSQPRSVPQHRLYWAALALVCENLDIGMTTETLHKVVKVMLGYTQTIQTASGPVVIEGSIAFDAMNGGEFRAFLDGFFELVRTKIIPGINKTAFEREAREMMGAPSTLAITHQPTKDAGSAEQAPAGGGL